MKFIALLEDGEDLDVISKKLIDLDVTVIGKYNLIGVITGYTQKDLDELKIPGIKTIEEEKKINL